MVERKGSQPITLAEVAHAAFEQALADKECADRRREADEQAQRQHESLEVLKMALDQALPELSQHTLHAPWFDGDTAVIDIDGIKLCGGRYYGKCHLRLWHACPECGAHYPGEHISSLAVLGEFLKDGDPREREHLEQHRCNEAYAVEERVENDSRCYFTEWVGCSILVKLRSLPTPVTVTLQSQSAEGVVVDDAGDKVLYPWGSIDWAQLERDKPGEAVGPTEPTDAP